MDYQFVLVSTGSGVLVVRVDQLHHDNSAFNPSRVGKSVVIHVITWTAGAETLNGRPGLRVAVWSKVKVRGRRLSLRLCTPTLCVTQKAPLKLQYAACGAIVVLYAFATPKPVQCILPFAPSPALSERSVAASLCNFHEKIYASFCR